MVAPFDIFRADEEGHLLWCDEALSLDDAKDKVQALAKSLGATYVVRSQRTGNRIVFAPGPADD